MIFDAGILGKVDSHWVKGEKPDEVAQDVPRSLVSMVEFTKCYW